MITIKWRLIYWDIWILICNKGIFYVEANVSSLDIYVVISGLRPASITPRATMRQSPPHLGQKMPLCKRGRLISHRAQCTRGRKIHNKPQFRRFPCRASPDWRGRLTAGQNTLVALNWCHRRFSSPISLKICILVTNNIFFKMSYVVSEYSWGQIASATFENLT